MCNKKIYIALLHYPVYNKNSDIVATSVTNMDIHDMSRVSLTYGIKRFYIITPVEEQHIFVNRILNHWRNGFGALYNPTRKKALEIVEAQRTLSDVMQDISGDGNTVVNLVVTSASSGEKKIAYEDLRTRISNKKEAYLLIFGTGWGIADEVIAQADFFLEPIKGFTDYNHLSVRSAVSISLDRLLGKR